jgi:nucleotide-binding universal stress UspA family protein
MSTTVAAIDDRPVADEVIGTAVAVAAMFDSSVDVVHVRNAHDASARAAAQHAGRHLTLLDGPTGAALLRHAARPEVVGVVIGASERRPGPPRLGHVATEIVTSLGKRVVVIPPGAAAPRSVHRLLVPLDGTRATMNILERGGVAPPADVEAVLLHVHETVPMFTNQAHHEFPAWSTEFVRRYCPPGMRPSGLQVRVGVPADEVLLALGRTQADLVVLGWARRLTPGRAKVVRALLERGTCPVVLLPGDPSSSAVTSALKSA